MGKATVMAISRHRSIVEGYERAISQAQRSKIALSDNCNAQLRANSRELHNLATRNAHLVAQLENAAVTECTWFWGIVWFVVGAVMSLAVLVCLSLIVYP